MAVDADRHVTDLRPTLRARLEELAEGLGVGGPGHHELTARFEDGHLRWFERRAIRVPASVLESDDGLAAASA